MDLAGQALDNLIGDIDDTVFELLVVDDADVQMATLLIG